MKGSRIRRLYDELSARERFCLMVRADARGDEVEREELIRSAPRTRWTWTGPEPEFLRLARGTEALCEALFTGAGPWVGWLGLLELLRGPCHRAVDALLGLEPEDHGEDFPLTIMGAAHDWALGFLATMLRAFAQVLEEELGLEAELVLASDLPALERVLAPHRAEIEGATVDPELLQACTRALREAWRAGAGSPPDVPAGWGGG